MSEEKTRKLTPALEILEASLAAWRQNLKPIILVYFWGLIHALVPLFAIFLIGALADFLPAGQQLLFRPFLLVIGLVGSLLVAYFAIRAYLGLFLLLKQNYQGVPLEIFKQTRPLFWSYLGVALLAALFVLLWSLLFLIPGIIYAIFYSFAAYVFIFEGLRGKAALRRSRTLVKGYWWPVFGRLALIGVLLWLLMWLLSAPLYIWPNQAFSQFWMVVTQIIEFLVGPIVLLFSYRIYQDLVKIKERPEAAVSSQNQLEPHAVENKQ